MLTDVGKLRGSLGKSVTRKRNNASRYEKLKKL